MVMYARAGHTSPSWLSYNSSVGGWSSSLWRSRGEARSLCLNAMMKFIENVLFPPNVMSRAQQWVPLECRGWWWTALILFLWLGLGRGLLLWGISCLCSRLLVLLLSGPMAVPRCWFMLTLMQQARTTSFVQGKAAIAIPNAEIQECFEIEFVIHSIVVIFLEKNVFNLCCGLYGFCGSGESTG